MVQLDAATRARILIVRLSALGDVAYALPALVALRRHCPHAHITWAVEEAAADLLRNHPQLDDLIVVPRKTWRRKLARGRLGILADVRRFRRDMRARGFDYAIDLQGNLRSALVTAASGAAHKVGFAPPCSKEHSHALMNHAIEVDPNQHKVKRNLALLAAMGVAVDDPQPEFPPATVDDMQAVSRLLEGLHAGDGFVLMHPGVSRFGAFKQWPPECYARLSVRLRELGISAVVSAGPGEEQLAKEIAAESGGAAATVEGLSLPQMVELIRRAGAFVASDTGPTQIAWMLGTPTAALMGPKDPALYGPLGSGHRKLTVDIPCRPCNRRRCSNNRCMTGITVEAVLNAVLELLASRGRPHQRP